MHAARQPTGSRLALPLVPAQVLSPGQLVGRNWCRGWPVLCPGAPSVMELKLHADARTTPKTGLAPRAAVLKETDRRRLGGRTMRRSSRRSRKIPMRRPISPRHCAGTRSAGSIRRAARSMWWRSARVGLSQRDFGLQPRALQDWKQARRKPWQRRCGCVRVAPGCSPSQRALPGHDRSCGTWQRRRMVG